MLFVLVILLMLLLPQVKPGTDLALEFAKGVLTLITAILVAGVLSFLLTQFATKQTGRNGKGRRSSRQLQELKAGYERIEVARFLLSAHRYPWLSG